MEVIETKPININILDIEKDFQLVIVKSNDEIKVEYIEGSSQSKFDKVISVMEIILEVLVVSSLFVLLAALFLA